MLAVTGRTGARVEVPSNTRLHGVAPVAHRRASQIEAEEISGCLQARRAPEAGEHGASLRVVNRKLWNGKYLVDVDGLCTRVQVDRFSTRWRRLQLLYFVVNQDVV